MLFTKVDDAAGHPAADGVLAFRLARHRCAQEPADLHAARLTLLPLYTEEAGGTVFTSADTWPGTGGALGLTKAGIADAKAKGVKPTGGAGFAYLRGPDDAISSTRATCRPSASTTFTCTRTSRSARSSGTRRI